MKRLGLDLGFWFGIGVNGSLVDGIWILGNGMEIYGITYIYEWICVI